MGTDTWRHRRRWCCGVLVVLGASVSTIGPGELPASAASTARISGTVTLPDGTSDVICTEVMNAQSGNSAAFGCRDGSGPFSFDVVPGWYYVRSGSSNPASLLLSAFSDGSASPMSVTPFEIEAGQTVTFDFVLVEGGQLQIRHSPLSPNPPQLFVVDADNATYLTNPFWGGAGARIDAERMALTVPPGSYKVLAQPYKSAPEVSVWAPGASSFADGATYTVSAGEIVEVDARTPASAVAPAARRDAANPLATLNHWRVAAGLPAVGADPALADLAQMHADYFAATGITGHTEDVGGDPHATVLGNYAGPLSVIAYMSPSPGAGVESLLFNAALHAQRLLDASLARSAAGWSRRVDTTQWSLNVFVGYEPDVGSQVVTWPPPGSTVPTNFQGPERPDPLARCPGSSAPAGLPVQLKLPSGSPTVALAHTVSAHSVAGPSGPLDTCLLVSGDWVTVIPRFPLPDGRYAASITVDGQTYAWSFDVAVEAPLGGPNPLTPRVERRVQVADGPADVWLQLTTDRQQGPGWAAVYPCDTGYAGSSSNNFTGTPMGVPAAVSTDADGNVCIQASVVTDVIVDKLAEQPTGSVGSLAPIPRAYDSRAGDGPLVPHTERRVRVADGPADVWLQLTTDRQQGPGWAAVYPCDAGYAGSSSNNFAGAPMGVPVAVTADAGGDVCIRASVVTDVIVDKLAESPAGTLGLLSPIPRMYDSRGGDGPLVPHTERRVQVAGGAADVWLQLTTDRQQGAGWAAAYPCETGYAGSSSNNFVAAPMGVPVAVRADSNGDVCIRASVTTDVIVDKLAEQPAGTLGLLSPIPRTYDSRVG